MKVNYTKVSNFGFTFFVFLIIFHFGCSPSLPSEIQQAWHELPDKIDFNFHVRPILSDRCYKCHGPDDNAREAGLRLDLKEGAFAKSKESKGRAFVKGSIEAPPKSGKLH